MTFEPEKYILELKDIIVKNKEKSVLRSIILNTLESIDKWRLTSNIDTYDIVPDILGLVGKNLENKTNNVEEFHDLNDGLDKGLCAVGFREENIVFSIEKVFFNSKKNTIITCYLKNNSKTTRIIMQCTNYNINNLFFHNDYDISISSVRLSFYNAKNTLYSITVYKNSRSEILIYKKISSNLFLLNHLEYNDNLKLAYEVNYTYECDELGEVVLIKNSNDSQVYPLLYQHDNDIKLFEELFSKFNTSNKKILNEYTPSIDMNSNGVRALLLSVFKDFNFNELEEVLEIIYPIYELPKEIFFIEYINDELNINFTNWSNLNEFLVILQNTIQDLVDEM